MYYGSIAKFNFVAQIQIVLLQGRHWRWLDNTKQIDFVIKMVE
jgi:hypothetical protein